MDPISGAQWLQAGSNVLGKALQVAGPAAPAGPSSVFTSNPYDFGFDSSGWNVNFGTGGISSQATKTESDPLGLSGLASGLSMNWGVVALLGLGVVAVWAIVKR